MGFFVVMVRIPVGLVASAVLLLWSLIVFIVYLIFFIFLSIFGKLTQIHDRLNPWLDALNGVKCLPGLWRWVLRPYQAIFEEESIDYHGEEGGLFQRLKTAARQQQSGISPADGHEVDDRDRTTSSHQ